MNLTTNIILTSGQIITKPYVLEYTPAESKSTTGRYIFEKYCTNEDISNKVSAVLDASTDNIVKSENEWYYESVNALQTYHWHSLIYDTERTVKGIKGEFKKGHVKFSGTVVGPDGESAPAIDGQRYWGYFLKDNEVLPATEFVVGHVYYISIKNIKYGSNQSTHDEYNVNSGIFLYQVPRQGTVYTITKFCVPEHDVDDVEPWSDRSFVIKQEQFNPDPEGRASWPCIYLSAYTGDVINTEFDISIIDLTDLAGVTDSVSKEEAERLIVDATGGLQDVYSPENTNRPIGYNIHQADLKLYFPQYSVDTNKNGVQYMLTASTYIKGRYVNLSCFKFKRGDAIACPIKTFGSSEQYFEYIDFKLPDLYEILYGDICAIREQLGYDADYKNIYSSLNFSLYVVDWIPASQCYIKSDGCNSGQNSIMITEQKDIRTEMTIDLENESFNISWWIGNEKMVDEGDDEHSMKHYIESVYGIPVNNVKVSIRWVVMDSDNIYETGVVPPQGVYDDGYEIDIANLRQKFFTSWSNFKNGLVLRASVSLIDGREYSNNDIINDEFVAFLVVMTNRILVDQDVFAKLLYDSSDEYPAIINLDSIDMDYKDIHVTNKIENIIQNITRSNVEDAKNHIIQPVFYQTRPLDSIDINVAVTENIALQLDSYKSLVKRFILQIEGQTFKEVGRTANGVLFKVVGKSLPKQEDSGTCYILNQDYELVTTGRYSYNY